ncbi:hypothetical protein TanjilG_25690 [Lupinus angustifolius]|uniref:Amidohydrolase-related domain-containing protein n=1 Tax=Lupinus angustifolius TaxID=3871 RepID=A0A1J7G4C0_LUPAN|nr:hypothetical protein TanjilG_25690 [Lupinus angustifolius]
MNKITTLFFTALFLCYALTNSTRHEPGFHKESSVVTPHQRNLKDIAELYGCEPSLEGVEEYRRVNGMQSICSTCFETAKISSILIDDGFEVDKKHYIEWQKSFAPVVGRILRIERVAEQILDEIYGFKSIAAYYSGLEINTNVTKKDAEEALTQVLAGNPVCVAKKNFVDYIFLQTLEIAQSYDLPVQIHTGLVLQVYLDFGLAIPKLSVHGMISSLKELLEQAPLNKMMFSTDRYAFPETFFLGAKKSGEVVFSVLPVHALMAISQFLKLWKPLKISLREMPSTSIKLLH